jgi:hypothetical protein
MPRKQKYESNSARQAAYRERLKVETAIVDRGALEALHNRLERLQFAIMDAAIKGDTTAQECRAGSVDTMLEKLIETFEARAKK